MRRRTVLALAGAGTACLAGCGAVRDELQPETGRYVLTRSSEIAFDPPKGTLILDSSLAAEDRRLMRNAMAAARNASSGESSGIEDVDVRASSVFNTTDWTTLHIKLNGTVHQFSVMPADTGTTVSIAYSGDWAEEKGYYRFETLTDREQQLFDRVLDNSPDSVEGPHPEELMHFTPSGDAVTPGQGLFYILKNMEIYRLRAFVN